MGASATQARKTGPTRHAEGTYAQDGSDDDHATRGAETALGGL